MIAVICGSITQFEIWASENPEKTGRRKRPGLYEHAVAVTREYHIIGRAVHEVVRCGTWYKLPNLKVIEDAVHGALIAGESASEFDRALSCIDWRQAAENGGPPCFFVERGVFCLRAARWEGHGPFHPYVSLRELVNRLKGGAR